MNGNQEASPLRWLVAVVLLCHGGALTFSVLTSVSGEPMRILEAAYFGALSSPAAKASTSAASAAEERRFLERQYSTYTQSSLREYYGEAAAQAAAVLPPKAAPAVPSRPPAAPAAPAAPSAAVPPLASRAEAAVRLPGAAEEEVPEADADAGADEWATQDGGAGDAPAESEGADAFANEPADTPYVPADDLGLGDLYGDDDRAAGAAARAADPADGVE